MLMVRNGRVSALVISFLLGFSAVSATAQNALTVKVAASEGQVEIRRDSSNSRIRVQSVAFKVDDELFAGDTIVTGKNGKLVLSLSDGSQAVIAPKTTVIVQDLQQSPRTLLQLVRGKTRVHIQKLGGQPNPYRVTTPTAVIAVRGTVFDVLVEDEATEVFLHEGVVDVFNPRLPAQPILLNPGQTTRILGQRAPNLPGTFNPGRNDGAFRMQQMQNTPDALRNGDSRRTAQNDQRNGQDTRNGERGTPGTRGNANDRTARGEAERPPTTGGREAGGGGSVPRAPRPEANGRIGGNAPTNFPTGGPTGGPAGSPTGGNAPRSRRP